MKSRTATPEAFKLLLDGSLALSQIETNGIKIDVDYLKKATEEITEKIVTLENQLRSDEIYTAWRKRWGQKTNLGSREQLAEVLFNVLKYPCKEVTATGRYKADVTAFEGIDLPFVKAYSSWQRFQKAKGTYLGGLLRETVDSFLRPMFDLNKVATYRSCIAKGSLIEVVRDVSIHPKGIPIEDVKKGDYVYCYDDNLELVIRKVLWSGKTGKKKVIRIHWSARGKKGYLDLTPEHEVRLASGKYVQAQHLEKADYRKKGESKRNPKVRTLAMGRIGDMIYQTGNSTALHDHRLIYRQLVGKLKKIDVVHHKDGNHLNNKSSNLQKMSSSEHARLHALTSLTDDGRRKGVQNRCKNHILYGDRWPTGPDVWNWIHLSKFRLLRLLILSGGRVVHVDYDFNTLRKKAAGLGVDLKAVKGRFDGKGRYITRGRLIRLHKKGRSVMRRVLQINFYKLKKLMEYRGLSTQRRWANQCGPFIPHNHKITKVEWIEKTVDVYDLEVEEFHNFIANEICVHNSSSQPNFQNLPVRNKEIGGYIRKCFIPRKGRRIVEIDYSGIEVRIAAAYHHDPVMISYIKDKSKDMHRDMAAQCYILDPDEVSKESRYCAKNQFVFPQFYGSYYQQCCVHLWESIERMDLKTASGESVKKHLKRKGIKELGACDPKQKPIKGTFEYHIQKVEEDFWGRRFSVYGQWKEDWYAKYRKEGGISMLTGFRIEGLFKKNEVLNYGIQGAAFHCLLSSLIKMQKYLNKNKMKSMIVGQIHDSMVGDVVEEELQDYLGKAHEIMTEQIPAQWSWINVPLEVEAEVTSIDGSWYEKAEWICKNGTWQAKEKK